MFYMKQPSSVSEALGFEIATRLEMADLSQREAALKTGIALSTLHRRLHNGTSLLASEIESLAAQLGTTPSQLWAAAEARTA